LKTEVKLPDFPAPDLAELKRKLGIFPENRVIVAGSTRKGEEGRLLRAFRDSRRRRDDLRLILAPRRVGRFQEVEKLALGYGFRVQRRTNVEPEKRWDVLILDTLGELAEFYALSDVSFVGGSLVEWGGHNILEPAYYGKPLFFGPHTENFAFLAGSFVKAKAARIIVSDEDLADMFALNDEPLLQEMGRRGREVLDSLSGATMRTIRAIEEMLSGG